MGFDCIRSRLLPFHLLFKSNISTSNSKYKNLTNCFTNILMLIYKGDLPNNLSLIYSVEGLSTHFWIERILEKSSD